MEEKLRRSHYFENKSQKVPKAKISETCEYEKFSQINFKKSLTILTKETGVEGVIDLDSGIDLESSIFSGVDVEIVSGLCILCMLTVGFGEIGGGVTFDFMERDLFGGNAGGRLELVTTSFIDGVVLIEMLYCSRRDKKKCEIMKE